MKNTFLDIRRRMSYSGYYTQSDVATFLNVSRQYVNKMIKEGKLATIAVYNKLWVKFDEGEKGKEIFGENPLNQFLDFGFHKRTKSFLVSNNCVCDLQLLDNNKISLKFYNQHGNCISLESDLKTVKQSSDI